MEPVLIIAGATALNIALVALVDVLGSKADRLQKLGWGAVVLGLPLIGAILYYMRAERRPGRPARRSRSPIDEDLPVPTHERRG